MENHDKPIIGVVSPCYNEELVLPETSVQLNAIIADLVSRNIISEKSFAVFVDDGSKDKTWNIIEEKALQLTHIKGLKLAGNVGHQKALLAGLLTFKDEADALISIDADLQDDVRVIAEMIVKYKSGIDVVYGVRKERATDTFFKRNTALLFYNLMKKMKVNIIHNHADYRLCSQRVLNALAEFGEVNLFLRGIIPTIGFSKEVVYYDRLERFAGESKYPFRKMAAFAWNGVTSFSNYPLKLVTIIGFVIFFFCLIMTGYALFALYTGNVVPGWLSTVLPMYFLGGVQLFCFGILGEYIGKIYSEVKQRPRYFIDKRVD
ncbi:glycosyltransferase family 2 protein [Flavobacterium sp. J49]|uniref:glycosyltransferase family 2 protein n=1 Tax=Flavobacterium sp. J49 TaxID=2718534 RepID=UPI0015932494|nr:glycosyltransferase family 2 protein [Flavobacterium sp. J49]MBF6640252.1 glycosyltransferase family 2 protein [Flavobacterium sp. J49]NIC01497.1 glycosyltransferase family 2 protein [Flavobacterium sp. J49]